MSSTRKKISIHDYPEHLNPFSEPTVPLSKTGTIFVDRLNMSGTWSSKITKRVNRSVTWIEKSWLGIEDSKKYKIQSAKTGTSVESNYAADSSKSICDESRPTELADSHSSEKRGDSDYQQVREQIRETIVNPNEMISSAKCGEERKEIKKKKKRPAPQPPSAASDASSTPSENSHSASAVRHTSTTTSEENQEKMENTTTNASVEDRRVISHSSLEKSYSTSCESENADSGIDSRPFSDSSVYEPSSPSKSENDEDFNSDNGRMNACAVPTIGRPNRPSRSKEDGEAKLSRGENESPKEAEKELRRTSEECSTSQHNNNNSSSSNANDDSDDDEVFVNTTIAVVQSAVAECELREDANDVLPPACEMESEQENGPRKSDSCNGKVIPV